MHEGTMRRSDERHFRCSCVVAVICARAFSFYPFLWWCLVFKISDAEKKKKNDDEYTWTDGWEDQIFFCFSLFYFFCRKVQKEENLFLNKTKISFSISTSERRRKSGENRSNRQRKRSTALQRLQ